MLHASLRAMADPPSRSTDGRRPDGPSGFDIAAARLDTMRTEALWSSAPWRAGLSLVCLIICVWAMARTAPALWLGLWAAAVVGLNLLALRAHQRAVRYPLGTVGRSSLWVLGEAAVHAAIWGALPSILFPVQPPEVQMLLAAAMGTMIAGAFLIALAPVAAAMWAVILTAALMRGVHIADGSSASVLLLLLGAYLAVILTGCLTAEKLISRYMEEATRERVRRDAITLLLREYEERGVGWLWQIDAAGAFSYVSPRLSHMLGLPTSQVLGQHVPAVFGLDARLGGAMAARERFEGLELQVPTRAGPRWVSLSGGPIIDPSGRFRGFRGVGSDITERHRTQERLARLASNDALTGLPNRQRMGEILTETLAAALERDQPCAMLYLDLDGFKPVNDRFGHPVGDAVLRGVARRLEEVVGNRGHVGRVGGDEFALVLHHDATRAEAERLGVELIAAISQPFPFDKGEARIGLSVGCAFAPEDGDTVEDLLLKADIALYEAKAQGRGAYRAFNPAMTRAADERRQLEQELRHAIAERELVLHYQPVVDARSEAIRGFEALVRWNHPTRGLLMPADFLGLAEEAGLIGEIGAWGIETACRDAATWPETLFVAVNISPRELALPTLGATVSDALKRSRLPAHRLELEVSERRLPANAEAALAALRSLRELGIRLAIDDFGAGRSALDHLAGGLFDTIKIDGACIGEDAEPMVRAIVAVAAAMRIDVVAEGVELPRDFVRMGRLGCHQIQGYLSGPPVPYDHAIGLLGAPRARMIRG